MKSFDLLSSLKSKLSITRRGFLQGALAVGASAAVVGCSKVDEELLEKEVEVPIDAIVYGTTGHNCGAKCITKAHVSNGRIIKFTADDTSKYTDGSDVSTDSENCTQSRACAKCRGYKHRLYHPGRLKYAIKQTKKRGDLTGFVRIPYATALNEIARKHKAITTKYGSESFHSLYACGAYSSNWQGGGYTGIWKGMNGIGGNYLGGQLSYTDDYSFHQSSFFGSRYTGYQSGSLNAPIVSQHVKNLVLWGSNILSTVNEKAYTWIRSVEKMKERTGTKVYFIGPEFVDTGVTLADEWIKIKPYTDIALMMGMMYHMIQNTFEVDGTIKASPMLDVKYIDTMVYGFFASPKYWVHVGVKEVKDINNNITTAEVKATGEIELSEPTQNLEQYNVVDEVPVGKSLASYIMGNGEYVQGAYNASGTQATYTSNKFGANARGAVCDYPVTANTNNTKFLYKKDFQTPKTPAWASAITGIPEAKIIELAEIYAKPVNHPVASTWAGGQTKQAEGVITFFAMHSMMLISKVWGSTGNGYTRAFGGSRGGAEGNLTVDIVREVPANPGTPVIGCTQWLSAIKFAFADKLTASNSYTGEFIPDHSVADVNNRKAYYDDSGVKSLVKWKRDDKGKLITITESTDSAKGCYEWEKDGSNDPIYSGVRFILNSGGNILINQHMNPNDSRQVYESLPLASTNPDDAETLCLVSLDNFLSPSPRWSDYVLPATTNWEQEDIISISLGNSIYIPAVSKAPGESKAPYDFTNELLKAYAKIDPKKAGLSTDFTGGVADKSFEAHVKDSLRKESSKEGVLQGKTWDEYLKNPFLPKVPKDGDVNISVSDLRANVDAYLIDSNITTKPFIKVDTAGKLYQSVNLVGLGSGGYGDMGGGEFSNPELAPDSPARFSVYSSMFVWRYENRYSKFHGYLTQTDRGMKNKDFEGDAIVYPIPMYFNYEDYFMEAYGKNKNLPAEGNRFLLTTTHDRYRAHSSQAENPYLRELTHRTVGGDLYSGDDWNEYALLGAEPAEGGKLSIPRLNKAIADKKMNATYSEIWMNDTDAENKGIRDGDLVEVWNAVGKVHCVARLSKRCVKGFLGLHQGCWYDPDPVTGVDVGGNCNTLMASRPSRVDHGNAQQSAMVEIKRVVVK